VEDKQREKKLCPTLLRGKGGALSTAFYFQGSLSLKEKFDFK